jgi:two-component system, NarL family, invasion response regulator UvrY
MEILICDDHKVIREGVRGILEHSGRKFTLTETGSADETMSVLHKNKNKYQLLILDIALPGKSGIDLLLDIKAICPGLPVMMLSAHDENSMVRRSFKNGASGYLTKNFVFEELMQAIDSIIGGGKYVIPSLNHILMDEIGKNPDEFPHEHLTEKEMEVMLKLASGKKVGEIALELHKSSNTISTYKVRILGKMKLHNIPELYRYCAKHNLL